MKLLLQVLDFSLCCGSRIWPQGNHTKTPRNACENQRQPLNGPKPSLYPQVDLQTLYYKTLNRKALKRKSPKSQNLNEKNAFETWDRNISSPRQTLMEPLYKTIYDVDRLWNSDTKISLNAISHFSESWSGLASWGTAGGCCSTFHARVTVQVWLL